MKSYDGLNPSNGMHKVKVTLQDNDYKGSFIRCIAGNCKGSSVLEFDIEDYDSNDIERFDKKDCTIDRDNETLAVTLTNPEDSGDTCEYELDGSEFMSMIVGIEIVDFIKRAD